MSTDLGGEKVIRTDMEITQIDTVVLDTAWGLALNVPKLRICWANYSEA